jgi:phage terminase large subunit-like protein
VVTTPLSDPIRSRGNEVARFAELVGLEFQPWQLDAAERLLEVRADGGLRYRESLLLLPRQNGKTFLLASICLWEIFVRQGTVLNAAQNLVLALEVWKTGVDLIESTPALAKRVERIERKNGAETIRLKDGAKWTVRAANAKAARGQSASLLIIDELREVTTDAWDALAPTTAAKSDALILGTSNAGTDSSLLLNRLRQQAVDAVSDPATRLGIVEWSAAPNADPADLETWRQANPALSSGLMVDESLSASLQSMPLAAFKTERLNIRVATERVAIDSAVWSACADASSTLDPSRPMAWALDVSPDGKHASLAAAQLRTDGRVAVQVLASWSGDAAAQTAAPEIRDFLTRNNPSALVWQANGPAAVLRDVISGHSFTREISRANIPAACARFAELAIAGKLIHTGDRLLTMQANKAARKASGDLWIFERTNGNSAHVDALYAAAFAVDAALAAPPARSLKMIRPARKEAEASVARPQA